MDHAITIGMVIETVGIIGLLAGGFAVLVFILWIFAQGFNH